MKVFLPQCSKCFWIERFFNYWILISTDTKIHIFSVQMHYQFNRVELLDLLQVLVPIKLFFVWDNWVFNYFTIFCKLSRCLLFHECFSPFLNLRKIRYWLPFNNFKKSGVDESYESNCNNFGPTSQSLQKLSEESW